MSCTHMGCAYAIRNSTELAASVHRSRVHPHDHYGDVTQLQQFLLVQNSNGSMQLLDRPAQHP